MDHKSVIYTLLERYTKRPRGTISDSDRLVHDLEMDGDDYGMDFVPKLQSELGFKAARKEWEQVITVGDVVRLVERHLRAPSNSE
jgi:acyl carrier protein